MDSLLAHFYPGLPPVDLVPWQQNFLELNRSWEVTSGTYFDVGYLLHLPTSLYFCGGALR